MGEQVLLFSLDLRKIAVESAGPQEVPEKPLGFMEHFEIPVFKILHRASIWAIAGSFSRSVIILFLIIAFQTIQSSKSELSGN